MAHLSGRSGSVGRLTRVQVVTVYVSDVDRAIGFYRDRLGLDLVAEWQGENGDRAGDTGDLEFEIADPDGNRVVVHS